MPSRSKSPTQVPKTVACNRCEGCLKDRVEDWSTRIALEEKMHESSLFITLTYSDENLPAFGSLHYPDVQRFMKRLRIWLSRKKEAELEEAVKSKRANAYFQNTGFTNDKIRFVCAGEYGEKYHRPHYHLIIFGLRFHDAFQWRESQTGYPVYRSHILDRLWRMGHAEFGTVTQASARYVAGYCTKKLDGGSPLERPCACGQYQVQPEFLYMSNRPGIGASWFDAFAVDAFPKDYIVLDGSKVKVPNYFSKRLAKNTVTSTENALLEKSALTPIVHKRKAALRTPQSLANRTPERLAVREQLAREKRKFFRDKK